MDRSVIAKKYANKFLNVDEVEYLGAGFFAEAFKAGDVVVKVTRDEHDAVICHKLIGKEFKHIVNVEGVVKIDCDNDRFVIVSELLRTLDVKNNRLDEILEDYLPVIRYALQDNFRTKARLKKELTEKFLYFTARGFDSKLGSLSKKEIEYLVSINEQLLEMMEELSSLRMRNLDIHACNVGFSGEVLKILDLGCESSDGRTNPIEIIKL